MKLIEAMKMVKDQMRKFEDVCSKIKAHCADLDIESSVYLDQKAQISTWLQSGTDLLKDIERLRYAIQKTNTTTMVTVTVGGNDVTKSISQWILRRKSLAVLECSMWMGLSDRGLTDQNVRQSNGNPLPVKVRRYYDPQERDTKVEILKSEPSLIDAKLEITNAITDLVE